MTVAGEERTARAALSRLAEPEAAALHDQLARFSAAQVWGSLRTTDRLPDGTSPPASLRVRIGDIEPERDLDTAARLGGRFLVPGDDDWPRRLDDLGRIETRAETRAEPSGERRDNGTSRRRRPPIGLWVRGPHRLTEATARSVAVVGSRAATSYGEYIAGLLGAGLADRRVSVVSGAAFGIDGAAHRGALAAAGLTVAVLACGVDVIYPQAHDVLLRRIAMEGLVVSEWPPGCAPHRHRFLVRNRVIAALTGGTVVVEASARSGARSTARFAARLGRAVMAVPGPATSAMSVGCHQILRESTDARLVSNADEICEEVGAMGELAPLPTGPVTIRDGLAADVGRVLDAVPVRRGATPQRIAAVAGVGIDLVLRALGPLELQGLIECTNDGYRLSTAARTGGCG